MIGATVLDSTFVKDHLSASRWAGSFTAVAVAVAIPTYLFGSIAVTTGHRRVSFCRNAIGTVWLYDVDGKTERRP